MRTLRHSEFPQMPDMNRSVIAVIQRVLPHYRVSFFQQLRERLAVDNIDLYVFYGREKVNTVPRSVSPDESWFVEIPNVYLSIRDFEVVWQRLPRAVHGADIVVVEQASRLLVNHCLQVLNMLRKSKLAFWGHGRNFQSQNPRLRERIKKKLAVSVDWWFAYTDLSKSEVLSSGYPPERITVVNNAIDTVSLRNSLDLVTDADVKAALSSLKLQGKNVGIYCGGMYPDKRLEFLFAAALRIRELVPNFEMILIGDGPEAWRAQEAAEKHPWIRYLGPVFDSRRAVYLRMSQIMLMPGLVGLAIVDSFVAGVPMATTDVPYHSPEIAYLKNGENGLITKDSCEAYSLEVASYLMNGAALSQLKDGCASWARKITMTAMVENFASGLTSCLRTAKKSSDS
jgi:glycosyltransferase involved in cell wall biosynthesis